ncbi:glycine cleavage system H protein [Pelagirhabdus alkalitolerans]|uniref:Glycine cleavage system H protein n=1 Tax=Pelagirhabdus alkalitolerans TaxID=1612202 RepID=A0A1G6LQ69_9BACI|nr:glycine cleavage system protein GcvH [Pelagirhabdus alkalitolerans]SDC45339.1 glycine cleavage system H protein [Pelagirhabdus alkalitolerans]
MVDLNERYYSDEHVWVDVKGNEITLGITEHAQEELGDIVFAELPEEGDVLDEGDTFGSVESVKTVSELYAPISGTITKVNEALEDEPELINEDPYEDGWIIKLTIQDMDALKSLMTYEAYQAFTQD